jgi:antitoxin component of MazEF toxin-antitoxin module
MRIRARLRKTGDSLGITVPANITRAYRLRAGDAVVWDIEGDEAKVQFVRVTTNDELIERVKEAAE